MKTVPRDFFNMKDQIDSNAQESYHSEPSDHAIDLSIDDERREVELVRDDVPPTIIENTNLLVSNEIESERDSDFDDSL